MISSSLVKKEWVGIQRPTLGASEETSSIIPFLNKAFPFLKGPAEPIPNNYAVLFNEERKVRVLNVSFGNFGRFEKPACRSILHVQALLQMTVNRVAYFLPCRGPMERVDGTLQEELNIMYHFFGHAIFENMVAVFTHHRRRQSPEFYEEDEIDTRRTLHRALKEVTGDKNIFCPPVVYIAIKDTGKEILDSLRAAPVKSNEGMSLIYQDDTCAKCNIHIRYGKAPGSGERTQPFVVDGNGITTKYKGSKCHPQFKKKKEFDYFLKEWPNSTDFLKGWPDSTNPDECVACKRERGSPGCRTVDGKTVDHLLSISII